MIAVLLCLVMSVATALAADLSPAKWPADERALAERLERYSFPPKASVVEGHSALVAATLSPIAIRAGIESLKQGGSAADAAATIALTQVTTALGSYVSYAGVLQLVYFDSRTHKVYSLDAGWNSYLAESAPLTIPVNDMGPLNGAQPTQGSEGRKTLVPGFMAGIEAMQRRFGRLPFHNLFEPAIWYAENGVAISPLLGGYFFARTKYLARTPQGQEFLRQRAGGRFVQATLAHTLRSVAKDGAEYMYTGEWGRQFVEAVQREGGHATLEDMRRYRPVWDEPRSTTFADDSVFAPGGSSEGGRQILEALNLIEEMKIDRAEPYFKDWKTFRDLSTLLQFVELGPYTPPAAAEFQRQNGLHFSPEDRVTKAYARAMAPLLQNDQPHHSDAIVVVDLWGNVAALVHSINTMPWGSTGIVVGGVPIPDPAGFQQPRLAAIKPGDRVPGDMAPVIVMHGTKPVLAVATVGSSLVAETARILLGTLGNRLDLQTLMEAPPLLYNFTPPKGGETAIRRTQLVPAGAYNEEFVRNLEASGVPIETKSRAQVLTIKGTAVVGAIDPGSGVWRSVETPALFGFASAY